MTRLLAVLGVALLVAFAGFAGGIASADLTPAAEHDEDDAVYDEPDPDDDVEADDVDDEVDDEPAMYDWLAVPDTAQFEKTTTIETETEVETITAAGAVDFVEEEMVATADMTGELTGLSTAELYVVDDTVYVNVDGEWRQAPLAALGAMAADYHDDLDAADVDDVDEDDAMAVAEMLDDVAIEITTADVDGETVISVSVEVDGEDLEELDHHVDDHPYLGDADLDSLALDVYVDDETGYVTGMDVVVTGTYDDEAVTVTSEWIVTDHDEPVEIVVPDEALDAPELTEDDLDALAAR